MKLILLSDLAAFPAEWHRLIPLGTLRGGELVLDDSIQTQVASSEWPAIPVAPAPIHGKVSLPESVRLHRLSFCTVCQHNINGLCAKCQHCGGRTIEHKVGALFEFCPLTPQKWGPFIATTGEKT